MAPHTLPFPGGLLGSGLVLGHVTEHSARIWLRCERPLPHVLHCAHEREVLRVEVSPDAGRDNTALVTLTGLTPDTTYTLDLCDIKGRSVLPPALAPQLRTLASAPDELCFGVVSCSLPFARTRRGVLRQTAVARMYDELADVLASRGARFVLNMGDQIYSDELPELNLWQLMRGQPAERARALFHETYRGAWAVPGLQRLRARFAHYMIWDDHEIRDDWGSRPVRTGAAGELERALWHAARDSYDTYQHALNPPTEPGVYHYALQAGGAHLFVLDLRGQRSFERGQLLGERQWQDLRDWLHDTREAQHRFVVSSVPLHHAPDRLIEPATRWLGEGRLAGLIPSTFYDRWCTAKFVGELEQLVALLQAAPRPIIVLAGDIHIGAALELCGAPGAMRVPQWITSAFTTASPLPMRLASWLVLRATNVASRWPVRHQFQELRNNFGIVTLRFGDAPRADFELYAWDGERSVLAQRDSV